MKRELLRIATTLGCIILGAQALRADSTISATLKHAYSVNAGWINLRPDQPVSPTGIVLGGSFISGHAYGTNIGWIDFGDGTPSNGFSYQNNSATDYGVNHDGAGNLGGMAYGANIGWINFGWAAPASPNRPRVNLLTGVFSGFAYSVNLGWINLGGGSLVTTAMRVTDSDSDGMDDAWERARFPSLATASATSDTDKDGVSDANEYLAGSNPNSDTDYFKVVSAIFGEENIQATVTFTTDPARLYRIETSDNLVNWQNSTHGTFAPDPGTTSTRVVTWTGNDRRFIRAVAVRPLP
ncbi:MAG TPA: hypothetical protein DIT13_19520 [Verrucomicrobiales bacterium]|nr:hypothetical protein [Verrucomicrobiales bacterium]HRJ10680.1 hypothetical protein [Prosthecobacter sp.]HRK15664.1 hypothetical protein [Prosthecobacter sp.]